MRTIENLVFKGGGVLGVAYAGAIEALDEYKLVDNIHGVAGTSSGSITAALLSLRYPPKEIKEIAHSIRFKEFGDRWNPFRIATKYGLYKGDRFLIWMRKIIKDQTGNENITFSELIKKGYRDLKVFATDLNTASVKEFSNDSTPTVIVAEGLRASMSLPLFFSAWKFPDNNPDNHIYVDGGSVYNYPITAFGDLSRTLGFFLYNDKAVVENLGYDELFKYTKALYRAMTNAQDIDFGKNKSEEEVTVKIDDFGIPSTELNLSEEQKARLFNSGKKSTLYYLERMS